MEMNNNQQNISHLMQRLVKSSEKNDIYSSINLVWSVPLIRISTSLIAFLFFDLISTRGEYPFS